MVLSYVLVGLVRLLVGATPHWRGEGPSTKQCIYFANHSSHIDTVALWSALPRASRLRTRPVAAADYWGRTPLRRYIVGAGLNAVLIDRVRSDPDSDPLEPLCAVLSQGESLILFPEGTRRTQPLPGPFRSGLYHLAARFPAVELIPVYLENLHRSLPKGSFFPVPLVCTVRFGTPLPRLEDETKDAFLARARDAVVALA
jgi:1-acyl-sn-glycerol-3-phosphate acyltransferase